MAPSIHEPPGAPSARAEYGTREPDIPPQRRVAPPPARVLAHDLQPGAAGHTVTGALAHTKAARDEWMKVIAVGSQGSDAALIVGAA